MSKVREPFADRSDRVKKLMKSETIIEAIKASDGMMNPSYISAILEQMPAVEDVIPRYQDLYKQVSAEEKS